MEEFSVEIWSLTGGEKSGVIESLLKEVSKLSNELDNLKNSSNNLSRKIEENEVSIGKIDENSKYLSESQEKLLEDISSFRTTKKDCEELFGDWQEKEKVLAEILDENKKINETLKEISSQAENTNQQAKDALEITTTMSLARAFKTRKDEAKVSAKIFSWAFYISAGIAILIVLGQFLFLELHSDNEINLLNAWLGKAPVLVFLFWVVQFSSKKSSQQHSIMEFYAQKQALAESYQGYKDQIKEFDGADSELEKLMTINLESVGKDSSTVMEQSHREKHSPFFELIELLLIWKGVKRDVIDKNVVKKNTSQKDNKVNGESP
ncbi:hypothetical protein NQF87_01790 [Bombella sp. TMW 2.2559]|uniref:Uncharacterized protein n=1 Tax=Bombella dulcis TaxID=2967339 RepID=A0ABT3WA80_9PROT|nr:hypothetical protein [Bombella dulcis]MCX5615713.1 hypothetical protein [Bombella dulcis]